MGGCQNYGPFLGTLNIRCRSIIGTQKRTIILTTTRVDPTPKALASSLRPVKSRGLRKCIAAQHAWVCYSKKWGDNSSQKRKVGGGGGHFGLEIGESSGVLG